MSESPTRQGEDPGTGDGSLGPGTVARWTLGVVALMIGGSSLLCGLMIPLVMLVPGHEKSQNSPLENAVISILFVGFCATSGVGGLLITRWAFARRVVTRAAPAAAGEVERAIVGVAARTGTAVSEADILMHTSLSLAEIRGALERMRRDGIVELVFIEDGTAPAYRVIGLHPDSTAPPSA